jgi:hypothetical protein
LNMDGTGVNAHAQGHMAYSRPLAETRQALGRVFAPGAGKRLSTGPFD